MKSTQEGSSLAMAARVPPMPELEDGHAKSATSTFATSVDQLNPMEDARTTIHYIGKLMNRVMQAGFSHVTIVIPQAIAKEEDGHAKIVVMTPALNVANLRRILAARNLIL